MSDLISRQAAIDAILGMFLNIAYSEKNIAWSMALDKIRQLPSAQPEQKKGKWVLKTLDDGYGEFQIYECDQCGAYTAQRRNFCYNCGARMMNNDI